MCRGDFVEGQCVIFLPDGCAVLPRLSKPATSEVALLLDLSAIAVLWILHTAANTEADCCRD